MIRLPSESSIPLQFLNESEIKAYVGMVVIVLSKFWTFTVDKLISIDDSITSADIYLKVDKPESHDNKIVEIKLQSADGDFFAKKRSNSFEESVDLVSSILTELKKLS